MCNCKEVNCSKCNGKMAGRASALAVENPNQVARSTDPFKIVSVVRLDSVMVSVRVVMDAKEWAKNKGDLGALYGIDISNAVYRMYGVKAYHPTVSDRERARYGIKTIELIYQDAQWTPAPNNVIHVDFINRRKKSA